MTTTELISNKIVETKPRVKSIELYGTFFDDETDEEVTGVVINFDPPLIDNDGEELVFVLNKEQGENFRELIQILVEKQLGENLRI